MDAQHRLWADQQHVSEGITQSRQYHNAALDHAMLGGSTASPPPPHLTGPLLATGFRPLARSTETVQDMLALLVRSSPADLADLVDRVAVVRCDSHPDVVTRRAPNLPLLTAAPLVGARENAITYCISDGRLHQQQRRCGEEQKVFHDILPAFLKTNSVLSFGLSRVTTKWSPCGRNSRRGSKY